MPWGRWCFLVTACFSFHRARRKSRNCCVGVGLCALSATLCRRRMMYVCRATECQFPAINPAHADVGSGFESRTAATAAARKKMSVGSFPGTMTPVWQGQPPRVPGSWFRGPTLAEKHRHLGFVGVDRGGESCLPGLAAPARIDFPVVTHDLFAGVIQDALPAARAMKVKAGAMAASRAASHVCLRSGSLPESAGGRLN